MTRLVRSISPPSFWNVIISITGEVRIGEVPSIVEMGKGWGVGVVDWTGCAKEVVLD